MCPEIGAMAHPALGLYQAAGFVVGCMSIHSLRAHAERLTPVLIGVAMLMAGILAVDWLSTIPNTFDPEGFEVRAITGFE
jgi:ABC-type Co2+ transport system permease subunit